MKKIYLKTFGIYLNGRDEGARAFAVLQNDITKLKEDERLFFDLSDVVVLAPSWCDEFFGEAEMQYPQRIVIDESVHAGIKKSFEVVSDARNVQFTFGGYSDSQ